MDAYALSRGMQWFHKATVSMWILQSTLRFWKQPVMSTVPLKASSRCLFPHMTRHLLLVDGS